MVFPIPPKGEITSVSSQKEEDVHTVADIRPPSPRPARDVHDRAIHDIAEALIALGSSTTPIVVPTTPLGGCEWCPSEQVTGDRAADAQLIVAHRTAEQAYTHRGECCAGHLSVAERDALTAIARHPRGVVWFELPYGAPAKQRRLARLRGWVRRVLGGRAAA